MIVADRGDDRCVRVFRKRVPRRRSRWLGRAVRNCGAGTLDNPNLPGILIRTGIWVAVVVCITMLISLGLAQLFNQRFPGRRVAGGRSSHRGQPH